MIAKHSLDIQYTVGVTTGVPTTLYSAGDASAFGFIDLANLRSQEETPLVLSTSYVFHENGPSAIVYAQLGTRGTTALFCSCNNGVYSFSSKSSCSATEFGPTFPGDCPLRVNPEVVAAFSSGGSFRARLTESAVQQYLKEIGSTNDISAQSVNFFTWIADELFVVLGTSASTPTWASGIALLNDARLDAGKPAPGFINPLLYSQGVPALNDITSGSNPGCGKQGFPALAGWDPGLVLRPG
ncbi:subtilisin-like protein [Lentinus brumalis]|uniref:Subtilisin-like protein n=1 Tax=Lentinus brumalis TaxID=2498619 RepID=A0A371CWB6_9APHY|nr:subtilisin-like protein [Polyporus brumalis]